MSAPVPDPSGFAARCLLRAARAGTLATQSDGQPFASLVTPATDPSGAVLMLLSSLSAHTSHLRADPRCALLVAGAPENANPQTAPRLTITGIAEPHTDPALRAFWVQRHPYATLYADFTDFGIWRLVPQSGHFVGGFARAEHLAAGRLLPDPAHVAAIEAAASRIIRHCNADHQDALNMLARAHGERGGWRMVGVDVDGFDLVQDDAVSRVPFDAPVEDAAGVRAALVRMMQAARDEQ